MDFRQIQFSLFYGTAMQTELRKTYIYLTTHFGHTVAFLGIFSIYVQHCSHQFNFKAALHIAHYHILLGILIKLCGTMCCQWDCVKCSLMLKPCAFWPLSNPLVSIIQRTLVAFASCACSIKLRHERNVKAQRWPAPFTALQLIFQYPMVPRHKAGGHVECLVNGKHRRLGALHIQQCTVTQRGGKKKQAGF